MDVADEASDPRAKRVSWSFWASRTSRLFWGSSDDARPSARRVDHSGSRPSRSIPAVSAFDPDDDLSQDLAYRLLINTCVTLFWRREVLDDTIRWLAVEGYQIVELDASSWSGEPDLHRAIARALNFPSYYGRNLDALNDCMRDVVTHEYGWDRDTTGLVLAFTGYDKLAAADPRCAHAVLDIVAGHSRGATLVGRRLICLVQSNDPGIRFDVVGATPVLWNDAEWMEKSRRPQ